MRLSYSTIDVFKQCKRWFYLSKIKKLKVPFDDTYLKRGSLVHNLLEKYYNDKPDLETLREIFDKSWNSYGMEYKMPGKIDENWSYVMNGVLLNLNPTHNEYKFRFQNPDYLGYADVLNTNEHWIGDYKTSTWDNSRSETAYEDQMKYYSWAYRKEFGVIPETRVFFVKYKNKVPSYKFTHEELDAVEKEITTINDYIETHNKEEDYPKCCDNEYLCPGFCPYKEICFGSEVLKFDLLIKGSYIKILNPINQLLNEMLKRKFSFEVQGAEHIRRNSSWDGIYQLYDQRTQAVGLGFKNKLITILKGYTEYKKKKFDYNIVDERPKITEHYEYPKLDIEFRPYQEEAINEFLKEKIGFIQIGTGGGKTEISMEIVRKVAAKTLFIVNKKELLNQTIERYSGHFGKEFIGVLQGKTLQYDKKITVATIQTLTSNIKNRNKEMLNFLKTISLVVVDEAHAIAAKSYRLILKKLTSALYRLSLTATAFRDDGNDLLLEEMGGNIIYDMSTKKLVELGYLMRPDIYFFKYKNNAFPTDTYPDDYEENIVNNKRRNNAIINACNNKLKNKKILLLTKRVEHGEYLSSMIPNSKHIHGSTKDFMRIQIMDWFINSESGILVTTINIASEGLNIPTMDGVINASANKGDVKSIQILGRVLRLIEGKKEAIYMDFIDYGKYTKLHSKKRYDMFVQEGYNVEIINIDEEE